VKPILVWFTLPWIGRVDVPAYFTLLTVGFGFALLVTWRESKKIDLDPDRIIDANLWMVVWGIIGARVLHLVADGHFHDYVNLCLDPTKVPAIDPPVTWCALSPTGKDPCGPDFLCDAARHVCYPPKDCWAALEVWRGGLAYYGGFIFAVAFAMWYLRRHKMPIGRVSDLAAPAIALGLFFGRMGCFFNGCCYGKETDSRFGLAFPRWSVPWRAQLDAGRIHMNEAMHPVHPTQLYEAIACLAIAALLYFVVRPRKRKDGEVLCGLLVFYGIARFVIEAFRDDDRGVLSGSGWSRTVGFLSTSQLISIPLVLAAAGLWIWLRRAGAAAADAPPPSSEPPAAAGPPAIPLSIPPVPPA
jgi:phosphatidylglycerol:prolipoprotein diacylglycerol transferase